jgi:hypothetical protein
MERHQEQKRIELTPVRAVENKIDFIERRRKSAAISPHSDKSLALCNRGANVLIDETINLSYCHIVIKESDNNL